MTVAALLPLMLFIVLGGMTAWMATAVWDNWRYPGLNREAVASVMRLDAMEAEFPQDFAHVSHRRVRSDQLISLAYRAIVLWETIALIVLSVATVAMLGATLGAASMELARGLGMLGALAFVINWTGFLVGGNYFCIWYGYFPAQATHFLMLLWGLAALLLLVVSETPSVVTA